MPMIVAEREEIEMKAGRVFDRDSAPLEDANGKKYGRVWYFRDITERKRRKNPGRAHVYLDNLLK